MEAEDREQLQAQENNNPIGVYGWRKRCLYFFVLLLVVILLVNLGLTIWILVVLNFNVNGMGSLRITDNGIRVEGTAEFLGALYARAISADQQSSLLLQSNQAVDISVDGTSSVSINDTVCSITSPLVEISTPSTTAPALTVNQEGVAINAPQLNVRGSLGLILGGPLETTEMRAPPREDLQILAPSGELNVMGSEGVRIEDGVGFSGIEVSGNDAVTVRSQDGTVTLEGQSINMAGLPLAGTTSDIYEVCVCSNGRLFRVSASIGCDGGFSDSICSQ